MYPYSCLSILQCSSSGFSCISSSCDPFSDVSKQLAVNLVVFLQLLQLLPAQLLQEVVGEGGGGSALLGVGVGEEGGVLAQPHPGGGGQVWRILEDRNPLRTSG